MDTEKTVQHVQRYKETDSRSPVGYTPKVEQRGKLELIPTLLVTSCCAFAAIGSFLFGYDSGIISSSIAQVNFIENFGSNHRLSNGRAALPDATSGGVVASFNAGAALGTVFVSQLSDRYGRKVAIFVGALFCCLGGAMQGGANVLVTMIFGRIFAGFGVGLLSATIPNYCSEVAPPRIRGMLGGMQQWMIGLGIVTAQWVGYGGSTIRGPASWRLPLALQIIPAVILAGGIWLLPESPRYLAEKSKDDQAYKVLEKLHLGRDETNRILVDAEMKQIQQSIYAEREATATVTWRGLIQKGPLKRRLLLACGIQLFTQWSGTNVIAYYSPTIYQNLGYDTQGSLFITGLYGAFAQVYNTICLGFVDKVGRRKLLIPSMLGMGAALCVEATLTRYFDPATTSNRNALRASVAMNFVFALFFTSLGVISWIYPSELFPTALRARGTSVSTFTNWSINLIFAFCSPIPLQGSMGYRYFYFFTAFNWVAAILVYFFYPETLGKSLEEISEIFGDFKLPKAQTITENKSPDDDNAHRDL